ncbi:ankyrin repeat-containing domain protein [Kockiozyma suomiensis]|uniref:ankyrin repeat-containing domain protein n=1 Tax=Kockiozyma suomiensis TaxID=1337062 RepID=UPI0033435AB4
MSRKITEDEVEDLIYSARSEDLDGLKHLLNNLCKELGQSEAEVLLQAVDPYTQSTPLHMACANGFLEITEYILSKFPTPSPDSPLEPNTTLATFVNDSGNTALHWACLNGHLKIVEKLCDAGADPFLNNSMGQDALFQAENNEKLDVVDYILTRFQDVLEAEEEEKDRAAEAAERAEAEANGSTPEGISKQVKKLDIQEEA